MQREIEVHKGNNTNNQKYVSNKLICHILTFIMNEVLIAL